MEIVLLVIWGLGLAPAAWVYHRTLGADDPDLPELGDVLFWMTFTLLWPIFLVVEVFGVVLGLLYHAFERGRDGGKK
jgi:hypothetical protein